MKFRVAILAPAVMLVATLVSTCVIYLTRLHSLDSTIRREHQDAIALPITQLQNILYNGLTAGELSDARLNLAVTAMDPAIRTLALVDDQHRVLLANRRALEGRDQSALPGLDRLKAERSVSTNQPLIAYEDDSPLLTAYYPVVLQLESNMGTPIKRVGLLFVQSSAEEKLARARYESMVQALIYGGFNLLAIVLATLLLHVVVSRRLGRVVDAARSLANGDLDARAALQGRDDLAVLGAAFDEMATRLKQDIDSRLRAEQRLREINESLEQRVAERTREVEEASRFNSQILSASYIGIAVYGAGGNCVFANAAFCSLLGISSQRFTEHNLKSFAAYEDTQLAAAAARVLLTGKAESQEFNLRFAQECMTSLEGFLARFTRGGEPHLLLMLNDVTARKVAEEALLRAKEEAVRANLAKSEFLARMSHELRTPMNAILGFAQLLELEELPQKQGEQVREIHQAGEHLLELINELLDLARIEAGKVAVVAEPVALASSVAACMRIVQPLLAERRLSAEVHCEDDALLLVDPMRLRQVLVNVLSNAVKYNREGGSIKVNCMRLSGPWIRIAITDTGDGIPPDKIERLFQPFERLGAEFGKVEGTGIGLALSKQLVELMGGRMGCSSRIGQGSTFWLDLPVADAEAVEPTGASDAPGPVVAMRTIKALYVEDNLTNQHLVASMFERFPHLKLLTARTAEEGLQMARHFVPDVILLDIHLPGMDGYGMQEVLSADPALSHIPVIALSADAMSYDVERGLKAGFKFYLTKPVRLDALMQAIDQAVPRISSTLGATRAS